MIPDKESLDPAKIVFAYGKTPNDKVFIDLVPLNDE
jgi:hypothetical protein